MKSKVKTIVKIDFVLNFAILSTHPLPITPTHKML